MAIIHDSIYPVTVSGGLSQGGYTCTFTISEAANEILPDQQISLYIDDKYGISWHGSHLLFSGYIPSGNIRRRQESGLFEVTAHTADYMLRRLFLPGTAYREGNNENTKTPSSLKLSYIIENILTRMTNASNYITWNIEESDFEIPEYSIDEGDPWSWFEEISDYDQFLLYFKRINELQYHKHPMFLPEPPNAIFDFNKDTMSDITIQRLDPYQVSQAYVIGFFKYTTFASLYPLIPVESGGKLLEKKGVPVKTQQDVDTIARRMFIFNNSKYAVTITDHRNHHLEIGDIVTVTHVNDEDGIDWSFGKRFYVENVSFSFDLSDGNPVLNASFELIEIPEQVYFNA